jgi:Tfp pilus assembly protein PilV
VVRPRRASGFSAFEGAVACVVLTVVAAGFAATRASDLRYVARSHEETVAGRTALACLERFRDGDGPTDDRIWFVALDEETARTLRGARAVRTITWMAPDLCRVDAVVEWDASDGGRGRVALTTLVAREAAR